ncbi:MAG: EamA family transporter [Betaproteobacteria bacterium]|nr:EamA family transporter [Betaproteobacteria bacterium]
MSAAILFALLSLLFAGLVDVVFRRYSRVDRSRGMYVLGMGVVWTALQGLVVVAMGTDLRIDGRTLAYGLGAGLLVSLANLCLIESLTHIDVGLASTVYRLNTIGVVVMAAILLAEPLTAIKVAGVLLGVFAVVLLYERGRDAKRQRLFAVYFWLVVAASLLRAGFGILSKSATSQGVDPQLLLLVNAPVWILAGGVYAVFREKGMRVTIAKVKYSIVSGFLIFAVANFLLLAIARGEASVVVPIANMSFLVALLISLALGMERLTPRKSAAIALTVVAIVVLAHA